MKCKASERESLIKIVVSFGVRSKERESDEFLSYELLSNRRDLIHQV